MELKNIIKEISEKMKISLSCYAEKTRPIDAPICDKAFEGVTDDGRFTFFRFLFHNVGYIGVIEGVGEVEKNYASLLPSYIESMSETEDELSKSEYFKKLLQGDFSSRGLYKFMTKYSLKGFSCFAIVLRLPKLLNEAIALMEQYGGNSLDVVLQMEEQHCVLVRFAQGEELDYRSSFDYAEFLVQSLKEELGIEAQAGVGAIVKDLKDVSISYVGADNALRYADVFEIQGNVHSYRDFLLVKILEGISETKLSEYLSELSNENFQEVFDDEEMRNTAETFLQSSLNVSETSRVLYMHRNTLLYRLDKIEKATGLNIRSFSDAVSFRVMSILYRLLGK